MSGFLKKTSLLDYGHPSILQLLNERGWMNLPETERIARIYEFVRDEIKFGYNIDDSIPASRVLKDGYGQCNTKGILLMALFRGAGISCRFHGFTIHKKLQKGAITGIWYALAPVEILHSWVEVQYSGQWLNLEGFILDMPYLKALQHQFPENTGKFCGYGVATDTFGDPPVNWNGGDTYIQKEGISRDLGRFDDPDAFFSGHRQRLGFIKRLVYREITRKIMNGNLRTIWEGKLRRT